MRVLICHPAVAAIADPARLRALHPDVEVDTTAFEIGHEQRVRREQAPFDDATVAGEPSLTDGQRAAFAAAEVILTLDVPIAVTSLAPGLRWIQAIGSGVGQYVACRLPEAGVTLTNGAGIGSPPIAEWVLARILQVYKNLPRHDEQRARHHWEMALGDLFMGSTVTIVGLGAIGREVARRCRPFGVHLIGVRRTYRPGLTSPDVDELCGPDDLHTVLARSDVVVAAAPGTDDNEDLFDEAAFAAMKPGALFVNVGRGTLVDERALVGALRSGHLRAAAIDVARREPLPADDPLWSAPNLFVSPHSSASGSGYMERAFDLFVANFARHVNGEPLENVVDLTSY